ncbi:MAG: HopJ type III effector protein [Reichenbachiella sp.]
MELAAFISKAKKTPESITFEETMSVIENNFDFTPTTFQNGDTKNEAGQNSGSCKLFAFAQLQNLTPQQTLHCFGNYYREDVLQDPNGDGHQNIRNFMLHGWLGIYFEGEALVGK